MKRLLFAAAIAAGSLACHEPTLPPNHTPAYGFDLSGAVFHWPEDRLPVRFYADSRGAMQAYVGNAINLWQRQFLYGEFRGVLVGDSAHADVIVVWAGGVPPDMPPDAGTPVRACGGSTIPDFAPSGNALQGPFHASLTVLQGSGATLAQLAACLRRTVVHEVGHSLGLFQEASDSLLIMNYTPWVSAPADGDRRTVEVLYHTAPNIAPPPR